jgi:MoxR-like ATPase
MAVKKVYGGTASKNLEVLRVMLAANIPVKLESLPGAGKTSHINAVFDASGGYLKTMVAVNHDPTDFSGIPAPAGDRYNLLPGAWAVELVEAVDNYPIVGLFLDEVNTAGRAVLAALLKVVDERIVGFQRLPESIRIILAMNPAEANGGADLTPAMANRVAHLPFNYPLTWWAEDMRTGFKPPAPIIIPPDADLDALALVHASAIADFAESGALGKEEFEQYPEEVVYRSGAFPTRRTWTLSARAMAASELLQYDGQTRFLAVQALVGRKAAEALDDYLDTKGGMDPVAMLNDPENFPLPATDDGLFTALDRMVNTALGGPTQAYIDASVTVLMRVGADRPGVAASGMRNVAQFLKENRGFISPKVQDALRMFKPVVDAAGGMDDD